MIERFTVNITLYREVWPDATTVPVDEFPEKCDSLEEEVVFETSNEARAKAAYDAVLELLKQVSNTEELEGYSEVEEFIENLWNLSAQLKLA